MRPFFLLLPCFLALIFAESAYADAAYVKIQKGTFMMGSPEAEVRRESNETLHQVTLTQDFEMKTTEVTQKEWFDVMGDNPSYYKSKDICPEDFTVIAGVSMCPHHPVELVSWDDIQNFIARLNQNKNDEYSYRLPTEAQWEYAVRAGSSSTFFFGDDPKLLSEYAVYFRNSGGHPHRVASKKPNAFGLYDMYGNVWELLEDAYDEYPSDPVQDPITKDPENNYRVMRGYAFIARHIDGPDAADYFYRSASRSYWERDITAPLIGFRLVRVKKESTVADLPNVRWMHFVLNGKDVEKIQNYLTSAPIDGAIRCFDGRVCRFSLNSKGEMKYIDERDIPTTEPVYSYGETPFAFTAFPDRGDLTIDLRKNKPTKTLISFLKKEIPARRDQKKRYLYDGENIGCSHNKWTAGFPYACSFKLTPQSKVVRVEPYN